MPYVFALFSILLMAWEGCNAVQQQQAQQPQQQVQAPVPPPILPPADPPHEKSISELVGDLIRQYRSEQYQHERDNLRHRRGMKTVVGTPKQIESWVKCQPDDSLGETRFVIITDKLPAADDEDWEKYFLETYGDVGECLWQHFLSSPLDPMRFRVFENQACVTFDSKKWRGNWWTRMNAIDGVWCLGQPIILKDEP